MDEKEFFAKLSEIGPDGKFPGFESDDKNKKIGGRFSRQNGDFKNKKNSWNDNGAKNGNEGKEEKKSTDEEREKEIEIFEGPEGQLAVDVYETPTSIIVESLVAGVKMDDLDISVSPDAVSIKGARRKEERVEKKDYLFYECFWGRFSRSIILPQEIDAEKAHATFKNGILKIVLPKVNRQKSRKIKVKFD